MSEDSIDFGSVFDLCRDEHRRIVLAALAAEQPPLTVDDLAKIILQSNHQLPVAEVSEEVFTQIRISLHHSHLPRLESAGVIDYDPERKLVEPAAQFDQMQPSLVGLLEPDLGLEEPAEL